MQRLQRELWSAEPHLIPQIYQQLTLRQRSRLVNHLAQLILKLIKVPPPSTQLKNHER